MGAVSKLAVAVILLLCTHLSFSQQLRLGKDPYAVEKSAVLELYSDNQGLLLPRIADTSLINALNPPDGMIIYFTAAKKLLIRANGYWQTLAISDSVVTSLNGNTGALTMDTGYISNFYQKVRGELSAGSGISYNSGTGVISSSINTGNFWNITGNTGTDPSTNFIGTTDNQDLVFKTNNTETARIVASTGDIKIGSATTGTIRATDELVLRQDGDTYGPSILRLRNRNGENGAIFETTDPSITLVDFIFKTAANQRNIRFEARASMARAGSPSFHIGGSSPDNPTLAVGDTYAAFNTNLKIGNYNTPTEALDVTGNVRFSGALMPNNTAGTSGNLLASNGSGAAPSWITMDTNYISNFYFKVRSLSSTTAPLTYNSSTGLFGITQASTSTDGYLSSTDWNTFNNKLSSYSETDPIVKAINGIVKSNGTTISAAVAGTDYLAPFGSQTAKTFYAAPNGSAGVPSFRAIVASDIPTLNQNTTGSAATLTTGRTIGITGDLTYTSPAFNGSGNVTAAGTLATVNANVGSFTAANITVNAKGLITAASNGTFDTTNISNFSGKVRSLLSGGTGITYNNGTGVITNSGVVSLNGNTGVLTMDTGYISNFYSKVRSLHTVTAPLTYNNGTGVIGITQASTSTNGYLSSTDWNTFNSKANAFSSGNLTETGSSILTITGGTNAVVGSGTSIQVKQANTTQNGFLSSTDWNTFNNKQAALTFSTGLTNTSNTITNNLSTGISASNQNIYGSTSASGTLTLNSTTNATKGKILFGNSAYDEFADKLSIGTTTSQQRLTLGGNAYEAISREGRTGSLEIMGGTSEGTGAYFQLTGDQNSTNSPYEGSAEFVIRNLTRSKFNLWSYDGASTWTERFQLNGSSGNTWLTPNGGVIGVGLPVATTPTALLHLAGGTASSNTAPLKFTAGTNLTTPEDGAIEYNGTHFYATIGSTRYQLDQQPSGLTDPGGNGILARTALNTTVNRTITGTTNRISITNGDGVSGNPTIDISSSYVGQNTITTLGTITTGTWNGTALTSTYLPSTVVYNNQSNTYTAGSKQIFDANGTNADIRLLGNTTDPTTLSAGDIWYNTTSNVFKGRFNTTTRQFATLDGTETLTNKTISGSSNTITNIPNSALTNSSITVSTGTTGTDFNISGSPVSLGGTVTLNIPVADATHTGKLSATDWTTFNNKGNGTVTSVSGTTNRITSTGGTTPVIDISSSYVGQSSITTLGTITTGTWHGTALTSTYLPSTVVYNDQSNTYVAGNKQIFNANGTSADIRLLGNTSDPSTLSAGDVWYNTTSNVFKGRFNTTTRQFATLDGTETFTNKIFSGSTNTLGGVTTSLGSDATGDIYYRNSSGVLTRLGIGTNGQFLSVSAGLPSWSSSTAAAHNLLSSTHSDVTAATVQRGDIITGQGASAKWTRLPIGSQGQILQAGANEVGYTSYALPTSAGSAGQQLRSNGTDYVNKTTTTFQNTPTDPSTTSSTTGVMMGLGGAITPSYSGTIMILISGDMDNSVGGDGTATQIRYGTGAAPANGAALTGTAAGSKIQMGQNNKNVTTPFHCNAIVTGLTVGTSYWIDLSLASVTGGVSRMGDISISVVEL